MKIIQVCPRYYPDIGGVETHVREISERLVKKGFDVEVLCTQPFLKKKKKGEEMIHGVRVRRFRAIAPNDAYFFAPQIFFYLKNAQCDLMHAHSYHALPALFAALAKKTRKFVFTPHYHGKGHTVLRDLLHKPYKFIGSRILRAADRVICVSRYEQELIEGDFAIPDEQVVFIPNGINREVFGIGSSVKDKKTILYVGRLERYKGIHHIIEALRYLDDFQLVIVGKGPYEGELRRLASRINVNGRIKWLKDLTSAELLEQYKSAGVFVFLSPFEAFGITVAEALASGTPCIVAETGALKEFVDDKTCFGLGYPMDVEKLAEKIRAVSKRDINRSELPEEKIKSWDEVVGEYEKLYREM
ncbi:MAG: glycosyltransferase family 1 protein [Methanophagales archaeon ANME-1-THS]|nr:MAG: glycosyltransferase family 1 protein [Methanophagales archaeon ANME-1-THS]